jgi:hypothetical protein
MRQVPRASGSRSLDRMDPAGATAIRTSQLSVQRRAPTTRCSMPWQLLRPCDSMRETSLRFSIAGSSTLLIEKLETAEARRPHTSLRAPPRRPLTGGTPVRCPRKCDAPYGNAIRAGARFVSESGRQSGEERRLIPSVRSQRAGPPAVGIASSRKEFAHCGVARRTTSWRPETCFRAPRKFTDGKKPSEPTEEARL